MFELDDMQRAMEGAARAWCENELAPRVQAMETGEQRPYELLRRLGRDLGISELLVQGAERRLAKLEGGSDEAAERAEAAAEREGTAAAWEAIRC